jgi:hypothetical protein
VRVRWKDWPRFEHLVQASIETSDALHREWGYAYIQYRMPEDPPQGYVLEDGSGPSG